MSYELCLKLHKLPSEIDTMLVSEYRYLLALLQIKHDEMNKSD